MSRILLADDDADLLATFGRLLRDRGHLVTSTNNGGDVMARLRDRGRHGERYDLIILDMRMPVLSGWDVLEELGPTAPPVIVTTGLREADDALRAAVVAGKVARVVPKPWRLEEMLATIQEVLDGQSADPPAPDPPEPTGGCP